MRRRLACSFVMVAALVLGANAASAQGFGFGGFGFGGGGFGGFGRGGGGGFGRGDGGGFGRGGGRVGRDGGFGRGGEGGYGRGGREGGPGRGGYGEGRRAPYESAGRPPRGTGERFYPAREAGQGRPGGRRPYPQPYPVVKHPYPKPVIVQAPPRGPGRHPPAYPRPPIVVVHPPYVPPAGVPPHVVPPHVVPPQMASPPPASPPPPRGIAGTPPAAPPPPSRAAAPQVADDGPYLPKEVLVTTRAQASPAQLAALEQRLQLVPIATSPIALLGTELRRYRIAGNADVPATVQALRGDPAVRAAQPNYLFETQEQPAAPSQAESPAQPGSPQGEPLQAAPASLGTAPVDKGKIAYAPSPELDRPAQYAIAAMRLTDAHKVATGADVRIAIIDTGLDETHPEIAGKVVDRFDAVDGSFMAHPHGTAMAGVIVADKTMVGIAPKARLIAIRAFAGHARGARGNSNDIIRAVDFAVSHHAQIVNLSFAGPRDELLAEVLAAARERGVIEVAAAGNQGPMSKPLYPAAEPGVIAITATDSQNAPFAMANRGTYIAAAAPGVDILAPSPGGTMQLTSGTSVAAAEASGVIALLLQTHPQMGTTVVRRVLSDTSVRLPPAGGDSLALIDALAVVQTAPGVATAH